MGLGESKLESNLRTIAADPALQHQLEQGVQMWVNKYGTQPDEQDLTAITNIIINETSSVLTFLNQTMALVFAGCLAYIIVSGLWSPFRQYIMSLF